MLGSNWSKSEFCVNPDSSHMHSAPHAARACSGHSHCQTTTKVDTLWTSSGVLQVSRGAANERRHHSMPCCYVVRSECMSRIICIATYHTSCHVGSMLSSLRPNWPPQNLPSHEPYGMAAAPHQTSLAAWLQCLMTKTHLPLVTHSPSGVHSGWPRLVSGGRPVTGFTFQRLRSSTNRAGARLPVFSSPQSSCTNRMLRQARICDGHPYLSGDETASFHKDLMTY